MILLNCIKRKRNLFIIFETILFSMQKPIISLILFLFIGFISYGQNDTLINKDSLTNKELKKERKKIIKYKKISSYNDTLILVNNDMMVGEFKRMDKSVVIFKTKYSEKDFLIKWHRVKEIHSDRFFIVVMSDGKRVSSTLNSKKGKSRSVLLDSGIYTTEESLDDIVFLEPIGKNFLSRLTVDLDIGITITKTNNLRQLTSSLSSKYTTNKWTASASFKNVLSRQDSVADVNRMDGNIGVLYFLPNDWYTQIIAIYLSNDEQRLALRSTYRGGLGYFFVHNSNMYIGAMGGLAYTTENYTNETDVRNSSEAYFGLSFNKYDIGDLSLLSSIVLYPSISENGRYRTDFNFDMKYDLPLDFFIKMSLTYNYDNQPIEGASKQDYVFTTSFGWEFN